MSFNLALEAALATDAVAEMRCLHAANAAEADGNQQLAEVYFSVAAALRRQCLGHLDLLDARPEPIDDPAVVDEAAHVAREAGGDDLAEWFETVARANRVHAARIAEALS